jgi:hypothetical protein
MTDDECVTQPTTTERPSPAARAVLEAPAMRDMITERVRQIDVDRFTPDHDMGHTAGELALAAASYINTGIDQLHGRDWPPSQHPDTWPWQREAWRPGDARANLIKGIAIAWAAIDRLDGACLGDGVA